MDQFAANLESGCSKLEAQSLRKQNLIVKSISLISDQSDSGKNSKNLSQPGTPDSGDVIVVVKIRDEFF